MRIQASYKAEQSDLMRGIHPDDAVECLTPSSEPSQGRSITVRSDSATENVAAFVEDCYNTADEKIIVSSSTKPNLIFKDEKKIVSDVDAEDSDDIDSEVDKYSDSVLAKLTDFGMFIKRIFESLVLQKHENNAYDLIHCGHGRVHRHENDEKSLLELNRVMRPGFPFAVYLWKMRNINIPEGNA
ncbi:hypothetical protein QQ045_022131 [Rhodiola kirilowii]